MRRLMAEHSRDTDLSQADPVLRRPQRMTVSQAFAEHGAAFSSWIDDLPEGLPANQLLDVAFDEFDQPVFEAVQDPQPESDRTATDPYRPDHLTIAPEPGQDAEAEMPAQPAAEAPGPASTTDDPEEILRRVRAALGDDPRIARLENRIAELETALAQEKQRADEAQTRLALVQEAMQEAMRA
jgi:hypothetical protein